ncbi:MAG: ATP-binding protein [Candidatus Sericytochromatia bacterium]|nr:ATP-binding protein [Candidatus Sericytochromatia bacterium]
MQRKKLPIGIQTFREIRENGHYYVDKTPFALRLIDQGKPYFLSRPRRFGKSLFLDTLKELFEGNRALFEGLHAEHHWDWSVKHPVLRLSFGAGVLKTAEDLAASLHEQLSAYEALHGLPPEVPDIRGRFKRLIRGLHEKLGQRVVVLVDEYDKPILDNLTEPHSRPSLAFAGSAPPGASPDRARVMREGLRDLYSVLKDADAHLRFVFITGVSKFSKVSLFSGLNNLNDITLDPEYSALCGYTEHDVDTVFAPELAGLDRERVRRWYNGYNWMGEAVYNPFDLLLLFQKRQFKPYWFETGTPTFLVELLAQRQFFTPDLARLQTTEALLSSFDVDHIEPEALLWQAGYLTLRGVETGRSGQSLYTLGYPNAEVEAALNEALLPLLGPAARPAAQARYRLDQALDAGDMAAVEAALRALFASIPHDWHRNNPLAQFEGFYASVFYSHLAALGLDTRVEDATNKGRIDLALRLGDLSRPSLASAESAHPWASRVYLFEFKVVEQVPDGRALAQLQAKGYAEKYREPGVTVTLVGIEFSREQRNVVGFEVAEG